MSLPCQASLLHLFGDWHYPVILLILIFMMWSHLLTISDHQSIFISITLFLLHSHRPTLDPIEHYWVDDGLVHFLLNVIWHLPVTQDSWDLLPLEPCPGDACSGIRETITISTNTGVQALELCYLFRSCLCWYLVFLMFSLKPFSTSPSFYFFISLSRAGLISCTSMTLPVYISVHGIGV